MDVNFVTKAASSINTGLKRVSEGHTEHEIRIKVRLIVDYSNFPTEG